jgi:uncharacterized heparinase superfamily protein
MTAAHVGQRGARSEGSSKGRNAGRLHELGLLVRTTAHLRPAQVAHRLRLRSQRAFDPWWANRPLRAMDTSIPHWPSGFRALEASLDHGQAAAIADRRFCFLGEERNLGNPEDWDQPGAARLWRFHLHYFEWAWALAAAEADVGRESFARLWRSWSAATTTHNSDAWSPYVASLRAWVLCDVFGSLVAGSELRDEVIVALGKHARFLRCHLELDVGGNHLLKNLKALVGLGVFLGDADLVSAARRHLARQLAVQVLADGGHFELSPSYHCQALGDLLDIRGLLAAADDPLPAGLDRAIAAMREWLGAMVGPDRAVPLFNDAVAVGSAPLNLLLPSTHHGRRLAVLAPSGYVVVRPDNGTHLVVDVGGPCPEELPAHAHADCLSFELWVGGRRVVVDTGTSTYEPGPRRSYERSTAAHNTVEVDEVDQTEVWGTFRAARRARATLELVEDDGSQVTVVASHDGYRHLPGAPVHRRRWTLRPGRLEIQDVVTGGGRHRLTSSLYLEGSTHHPVAVSGRGAVAHRCDCEVSQGFGDQRPAVRYRLTESGATLPHELGWSLTW